MTVAPVEPRLRAGHEDALIRAGRGLLTCSLFLSSILVARVGDYTAGDLVLAAAVAVTLFSVAVSARDAGPRILPVVSILIVSTVVGGGVLSALRAQSISSTLAVVVRLVLVILVLPWLARVVYTERRHLRTATAAFTAGAGLTGAGTIAQFLFGESIIPNTGVTNAGRFAGLTQNVSDTGGICSVGVVAALSLVPSARGRASRVGLLLALVGAFFGLVLSGSVSGLLSTAVGFALLALGGVLRPRAVAGSIVGFGVVLALSVAIQTQSGALNPIQRILQTTGQSADDRYNTADSRLSTYTEAFRKFTENPVFGSGLDPNSTIADGIYPAHNLFLAAAFEGGVLLAAGVLLAVVRPFLGGALRRFRGERLVATGIALMATELVFAMTAPSLYNRYFWIPVALLVVAESIVRREDHVPGLTATDGIAVARADLDAEFLRAGDPVGTRAESRHS